MYIRSQNRKELAEKIGYSEASIQKNFMPI